MIIAQISDTHIDLNHHNSAQRLRDMERVVTAINALDPGPEVVIHTGDIAHNGTAEKYEAALDVLKNLSVPLYAAAGNRDDRTLIRANFATGRNLMSGMDFLQYEVDDYPVRLIALDTVSRESNMGDYCEERAQSLACALNASADKPCALFMHHPPFEVRESRYRWQYVSHDAVERLSDVIGGHNHLVGLFCGHSHRQSSGTIAGVPVGTVPSVAIDLRLGDFPKAAEAAPVFHLHHYRPDAGFETELHIAT